MYKTGFTIRLEQPKDYRGIFQIHTACFPTKAEAQLVDLLRAAGRLTFSFVAEFAGQLAGHVAFSPVTAACGAVGMGLGPVGVLPTYRRQGIAAALIRAGLAACRSQGFTWCVVLGDPAYYRRFGFRPASGFGLSDEYGGGDAFQAMELISHGLPIEGGLVKYSPEFESVS